MISIEESKIIQMKKSKRKFVEKLENGDRKEIRIDRNELKWN